jgi:hypothetical protein
MEMVYFLVFIAVSLGLVMWLSRKSRDTHSLERRKERGNLSRARRLRQPVDSRLAHRDELWNAHRQEAQRDVSRTDRYIPRSEKSDAPEYDGYSRRDRHHVTSKAVHVKDEGHAEEVPVN